MTTRFRAIAPFSPRNFRCFIKVLQNYNKVFHFLLKNLLVVVVVVVVSTSSNLDEDEHWWLTSKRTGKTNAVKNHKVVIANVV